MKNQRRSLMASKCQAMAFTFSGLLTNQQQAQFQAVFKTCHACDQPPKLNKT